MFHMPLMELDYIRYAIQSSLRLQQKSILGQEACINNSSSIIFGLKMRIWETYENFVQALFGEVLAEMPHSVCSYDSNVIIFPRILNAIASYFLSDKVYKFVPYLHPQDELIGEQSCKPKEKSSVAAADVDDGDIDSIGWISSGMLVMRGMLYSIGIRYVILLQGSLKEERVVGLPINKGLMGRVRERSGIEWVDVRPHSIVFLLWEEPISFDDFVVTLILFRFLTVLSLSLHKRNIYFINFLLYMHMRIPFKLVIVLNIDILMQYIQNIAEYIEGLSYASLYDLNNSNKLLAEQQLTTFLFELPLTQYDQLLEKYSEHVVFAVAAILLKNVLNFKQHIGDIMVKINSILIKWYQPDGTLMRSQGRELKLYVENTFGQFMGNCLKVLFQRQENKQLVNQFLDNLGTNPHYRLFLYYRFIESVSTIDGDTMYVSYRTLLSSFQQSFVPRIFEALFPYFMSISDIMDINELSLLHSTLTVNDFKDSSRPKCALEFSAKNRFTQLVFQLLEHVIAFKYNISHKEYDDLEEFQKIIISFPQQLLIKIIRVNFLDALYNILMQLMRTKEFRYQQICLSCLKKILLAKISYITIQMQTHFIFKNMEGVLNLLQLIMGNKVCHRLNAVHILQCNINFISTFGLDGIELKIKSDQRYHAYFNQWLQLTRSVPLFLLQNDTEIVNSENQLFLVASEMLTELANELKVNNIRYQKSPYAKTYRDFTATFLNAFIARGSNILGSKPFSFEEFKKSSNMLLSRLKIIMTYSYAEVFNNLNQCCDYLFRMDAGQHSVGNLILLIRQMIRQSCFLEESIFGQGVLPGRLKEIDETGVQLQVFGQILAKTINFIIGYQNQAVQFSYLNSAMVLFLATLLDRCSRRLSIGEEEAAVPPFINDGVYRQIKLYLQQDDESFLLTCLCALAQFIRSPGMANIDYIFEVLYEIIVRIKWNMKREYFKKTQIYQQMLKLFKDLSSKSMPVEYMKWRVLLFKIITALSFDDALDEYRGSIRQTVGLLKTSAASNQWVKILYDLTGIFESIEGQMIFRYFLRYFAREMNFSVLLKELFLNLGFSKPESYLKDVLHLSWVFISNRSNRLAGGQGIQNIYQMLMYIIPYWNQYLQIANSEQQQALMEVYTGLTTLINDDHLNICLLDAVAQPSFRKFIKLVIISMCSAIETVESSASFANILFNVALLLTSKVTKQLFNIEDLEIGKGIHFLVNKLMRKLTVSFENIAAGAFEESLLEPMLKTIDNYYNFLRQNRRKKHLKFLTSNIEYAMSDKEEKESFLEAIIKIAMEFRHHFSATMQLIANICINLIDFYKIEPINVTGNLGLKDGKDIQEIERIFRHVRESFEDYVWLTLQMKDWLKVQSRFATFSSDEY